MAPFDSFHSNLGEIIIFTPKALKSLGTQEVKPEPQKTPQEISAQSVEAENKEVRIDEDSAQGTRSKDKENKTTLSDEEINQLLFDELFMWEEEEEELLVETSDWYKFYALELGGGYADNPLGAAHNPESSSFAELNLESFLLSQKNPQHEVLIYLFGEAKNFFELEKDEIAGLVLSQFDYSYKPPTSKQSYGLRFQHTYFDQPMDMSTLGSPERLKITSLRSEISPNLKWKGDNGEEGKVELSWSEERLRQFEDQSSKFGISASLSNKSTHPFKWYAKVFHIMSDFKDRIAKDGLGNPLNGNSKTKHIGLSTKLTSASEDGWSKGISIGSTIEKVKDNQGGYYNYHRLKTSLGKKFETEKWESEISLGHNRTRYSERLVNNQGKFSKDYWSIELGINRELKEDWKTYAKWMHETDSSNDPNYAFENNIWSVGLAWEK
ncbi:MAG: hypothetical protein VW576_04685 [Opitutae bacterium]